MERKKYWEVEEMEGRKDFPFCTHMDVELMYVWKRRHTSKGRKKGKGWWKGLSSIYLFCSV